jgi:2-polyprenyl-6-methoxyphenol hydroxylase-like FAD-dependent oxidoreductase
MTEQSSTPTSTSTVPSECDVLVIGGGPAGSTAGALLAQRGYKVVVLEKAHHPRFHIGESLLPANLPLFEKLGVAEAVKAIGMEKWGAEFVSPWHASKSQTFKFSDAWDKSMPFSYQVRRSELDEILIRNAARLGADVIEGCRVKGVAFAADHSGAIVHAQHEDGRAQDWRARFVVDASGRDTLLGKQLDIKRRNHKHNSSALYGHFTGVTRHAGQDEGNITIFWFDYGWFWLIPLADGTTSIGAVVWPHYLKGRSKPVKAFFLDSIAMCPALSERLTHATLSSDVEVTANSRMPATARTVLTTCSSAMLLASLTPCFRRVSCWPCRVALSGPKRWIPVCGNRPKRQPRCLILTSRCDWVPRSFRGLFTGLPTRQCVTCSWGRAMCGA